MYQLHVASVYHGLSINRKEDELEYILQRKCQPQNGKHSINLHVEGGIDSAVISQDRKSVVFARGQGRVVANS